MSDLIEMLKHHEGYRKFPYKCTAGKTTIAYGRNLDNVGISEYEAEILLVHDIKYAQEMLIKIFPNFYGFSNNRQNALTSMMFNLGVKKFLLFRKMILAIKKDDWEDAANEAEDSDWHKQVKSRALEIEWLIREG